MDQATSDLVKSIIAGQARHVCTALAGSLVTYAIITPDQSNQTITVLTGIVVGAVGAGWSWWQKKGHAIVIAKLQANADYWRSKTAGKAAPQTPSK